MLSHKYEKLVLSVTFNSFSMLVSKKTVVTTAPETESFIFQHSWKNKIISVEHVYQTRRHTLTRGTTWSVNSYTSRITYHSIFPCFHLAVFKNNCKTKVTLLLVSPLKYSRAYENVLWKMKVYSHNLARDFPCASRVVLVKPSSVILMHSSLQ